MTRSGLGSYVSICVHLIVMAHDLCQNFVFAQYRKNEWMDFYKI